MTRHGKIARLPRAVREKLNERLDNGEAGVRLAKWLNRLPEVKKVLRESFGAHPITPQNVSQWKCGGFCEWQTRQEALEQAREMSAGAKELLAATEYKFSDYLATVLAARYAKVLSGWDGKVTEEFNTQLRALRSMCLDVAELRRGDHSRERVTLEGRRLHQNRERTEREVYEMFKEWAFQPAVRNCLCKEWETPEEKEARLEEIFGIGRVEEGSDGVVGEDGEEVDEDENEDEKAGVTGETPVPLTMAATGEALVPLAAEAGASAGLRRTNEGPAQQEPRADVVNVRPTGSEVYAEGKKIEVDHSKSQEEQASPRETGGTPVPLTTADGGTAAPVVAAEVGGTPAPLTKAMAGETPAPLAATQVEKAEEKIEVDRSKSQEEAGPASDEASASVEASSSAEATVDRSADGTNGTNGTNRANKKAVYVSADGFWVGMSANDLLKPRSERKFPIANDRKGVE